MQNYANYVSPETHMKMLLTVYVTNLEIIKYVLW